MIGLFVTICLIVLFALVVEVSATALKLTGLNINVARFQALSALTGTGFTSSEVEDVVSHPRRRKIIMVLMRLGPVGYVILISMVIISIGEKTILFHLGVLIFLIILLLFFSRSQRFMKILHAVVEGRLKKARFPRRVGLEEVLEFNRDFGICEIAVEENSRFIGKALNETDFIEKGFIVLAIKRDSKLMTIPHAVDKILKDDILFVFGNFRNLKEITKEVAL